MTPSPDTALKAARELREEAEGLLHRVLTLKEYEALDRPLKVIEGVAGRLDAFTEAGGGEPSTVLAGMRSQVPAMFEELMTACGGRDAPLTGDPVTISANLSHGFIVILTALLSPTPEPNPAEEEKAMDYPIGGFAPGNYTCKCLDCGLEFTGDKRAIQCEPCARKSASITERARVLTEADLEWLPREIDPDIWRDYDAGIQFSKTSNERIARSIDRARALLQRASTVGEVEEPEIVKRARSIAKGEIQPTTLPTLFTRAELAEDVLAAYEAGKQAATTPPSEVDREAIARVIDEQPWRKDYSGDDQWGRKQIALAKVSTILALIHRADGSGRAGE